MVRDNTIHNWPTHLNGCIGTLLLDPPWMTASAKAKTGWMKEMVKRPYPSMTVNAMMGMRVSDLCAPDAVILMWTTWGNIANAVHIMEAWGFRQATGMPWLKVAPNPWKKQDRRIQPMFGMGTWFRHCTELLLIGRRGKPFGDLKNPRPARDGIIVSPRLEHSRKPDDVHEWVEQAGFPCLWMELFARRVRPGWEHWGNEVTVETGDGAKRDTSRYVAPPPALRLEDTDDDAIRTLRERNKPERTSPDMDAILALDYPQHGEGREQ